MIHTNANVESKGQHTTDDSSSSLTPNEGRSVEEILEDFEENAWVGESDELISLAFLKDWLRTTLTLERQQAEAEKELMEKAFEFALFSVPVYGLRHEDGEFVKRGEVLNALKTTALKHGVKIE